MKNAFFYFFIVKLCQYIHEILGFRKLSEKHAKWVKLQKSHLFAFIIKKITLSSFSNVVSSKLIKLLNFFTSED